jgi:hypothetical protein
MRFMKPAAAALAVGLAATAFAPTADAGHRHRHRNHGAFFGGFAAGALLGALVQPRYGYGYYDDYAPGYYYQERRHYYAPPPRVYYDHQIPEYYGPSDYYGPCSIPGGSRSRPAYAWC